MNSKYQIKIVVLIAIGLFMACKKKVVINNPNTENKPVADFIWTGEQKVAGEIIFSNKSKNGKIYRWDFGNGTISHQTNPDKVIYSDPGAYDVVLRAFDGERQDLIRKTLVITADAEPHAHFAYVFKDQKSAAPATVSFINESVNADTYEWVIDGDQVNWKNPEDRIFTIAGNYEVQLTAIKGSKHSQVYNQTITILSDNKPNAKFRLNYHPYVYLVGEEIQLVNLSENSDSWKWDFGNGTHTTEQHPIVKYNTSGTYTITLIAKNGNLISDPVTINIKINPS